MPNRTEEKGLKILRRKGANTAKHCLVKIDRSDDLGKTRKKSEVGTFWRRQSRAAEHRLSTGGESCSFFQQQDKAGSCLFFNSPLNNIIQHIEFPLRFLQAVKDN